MKTISLATIQQQVSARKALLGMVDTASEVGAMRNKGAASTPERRELLRRAESRFQASGLRSIQAHF